MRVAFQRLLFDISYTRTQEGNVGITRTVRRLGAALQALARVQAWQYAPVAWHTGGFRQARPAATAASADQTVQGALAGFFRWVNGAAVRRIATALLPLPLLHRAWALHNRWTFNGLSAGESAVAFGPGDWLVIGDESWNYAAWDAAARARARGARVVLILYDLIPLRQPQFCAPLFTRVFRVWLRHMLRNCDAVMCISRATQVDLLALCAAEGLACPAADHFRLGSDLPGSQGGRVRPALAAFLTGDAPCFAAIGTVEPRKNHEFLLGVFDRLWAQGCEARLLVAGRVHPQCRALAARMKGHPQQGVRLLSVADATDAEVAMAYERSRALVFPSLAEGFGLPVVEARVRGCPVIASDLPAVVELADAGVDLVPAGSAEALAAQVLAHTERNRRADTAPMPPFTWDDCARQFLDALDRLPDRPWKT